MNGSLEHFDAWTGQGRISRRPSWLAQVSEFQEIEIPDSFWAPIGETLHAQSRGKKSAYTAYCDTSRFRSQLSKFGTVPYSILVVYLLPRVCLFSPHRRHSFW